ncbi:TPA: hypothetical protein O8U43_000336 [Enterobacter cloacae]|nr:hypothetical protein [Enterobacter cloacae]HDC4662993.1 hypothetical protein [Enterobacter cloacae]
MKIDHHNIKFTDKVFEQCIKLIDIGYWDNLNALTLQRWCSNFKDDKERYLAAAVLRELIFRNRKTITSMGYNIFSIILPQILEEEGIYEIDDIDKWMYDINSPANARTLPFRISVIANVDKRITKSGEMIYKYLQKDFFDNNLGIKIENVPDIKKNVKAIVLFDDIIGSGSQIDSFIDSNRLDETGLKIIYIPFAAVMDSVSNISAKYKNLIIRPVEKLDSSHRFFRESNSLLNRKDYYCLQDFLDAYIEICKRANIGQPYGFGDYGLSYILSDSTPNNNLSFLWFRSHIWEGLFKR